MNRTIFLINCVLLVCLIVANKQTDDNTHERHVDSNTSNTSNVFPAGGLRAAAPVAPGVQVNSLPHPFNLDGRMPYQVWVNGERLPLNGDKAKQIVSLLDLGPFEQPEDTAEIHSGAGWMRPFPIQ